MSTVKIGFTTVVSIPNMAGSKSEAANATKAVEGLQEMARALNIRIDNRLFKNAFYEFISTGLWVASSFLQNCIWISLFYNNIFSL